VDDAEEEITTDGETLRFKTPRFEYFLFLFMFGRNMINNPSEEELAGGLILYVGLFHHLRIVEAITIRVVAETRVHYRRANPSLLERQHQRMLTLITDIKVLGVSGFR
jgi:hypothetical protein